MNNTPLTVREIHGPYVQLLTNLQGKNGRMWLDALNRFNRMENPFEKKTISIERVSTFDPVAFIGNGWSIVEQDERSLKLSEVDLSKVSLETMLKGPEGSLLKGNESDVFGEEKLKRLKDAGHIRLDAKVLQTVLENRCLIPESWKNKTKGNITCIFFDGTILQDSNGNRYVLCLYWHDGKWNWNEHRWLGGNWFASDPSAVLKS